MPKVARVQHTYNHKSGLPQDGVVNTFYFHHPLDTWAGDTALELAQVVVDFYDHAHPGQSVSLRTFIAEATMAPLRHTVKVYDMADTEPRTPQIVHTTAGGGANNVVTPMPSEVALCMSYRGALVSGLNPARRRGRIYLGPLSSGIVTQDTAGWSRPDPAYRADILLAAQGMNADALTEGWTWMCQSGAGTQTPVDLPHVFTPITHVWVDDAWDTQRRRGAPSTSRVTADL